MISVSAECKRAPNADLTGKITLPPQPVGWAQRMTFRLAIHYKVAKVSHAVKPDRPRFRRRFEFSTSKNGPSVVQVDIRVLSPAELTEYQGLIGRLISRIEWMDMRLRVFGAQCRAILDGVHDEDEMFLRASPSTVGFIDPNPAQ